MESTAKRECSCLSLIIVGVVPSFDAESSPTQIRAGPETVPSFHPNERSWRVIAKSLIDGR